MKPKTKTEVSRKARQLVKAHKQAVAKAPVGVKAIPTTALPGHYWFTLSANATQHEVGDFQGRFRCDLEYSNPSAGLTALSLKPGSPSALSKTTWRHLKDASIVSGHDWVFINPDAVVDFDSRLTLKVGGVEGCFIAGRVRGRADLRTCRDHDGNLLADPAADDDEFVKAWHALAGSATLPLVLSVAFDVPVRGFTPEQNDVYTECRDVRRSLLIGLGEASVSRSPWHVDAIKLDLYASEGGLL